MISTAPGTLAYRVLSALVAHPGELDAAAIADMVMPEPRHVGPFTAASYVEHLTQLRAWRAREAVEARTAQVGRVLHRLQQQGLVERCRPARVAPWHEGRVARLGEVEALRLAEQVDEDEAPRSRGYEAHVAVLDRVRSSPGSVRAVVAGRGGWGDEVYADLVSWGVIEAPRRRWPTPKGVALVEGSR